MYAQALHGMDTSQTIRVLLYPMPPRHAPLMLSSALGCTHSAAAAAFRRFAPFAALPPLAPPISLRFSAWPSSR